jgi:uncharacterized protein YbaP (TraB family)
MKRIFISYLLLIPLIYPSAANCAPVLEVTGKKHLFYLIASNHLGSAPFKKNNQIEKILKISNKFCFENHPSDAKTAANIKMALYAAPDGKQLQQSVGENIFRKLQAHIVSGSISTDELNMLSPYAAAGIINTSFKDYEIFQSSLKIEYSVDNYILKFIRNHQKQIVGIEQKDVLLRSMHSVSDKEWRQYVADALTMRDCIKCMHNFFARQAESYHDVDDYEYAYGSIKSAYKTHPGMFSIYKKIFFTLRNKEMADAILSEQSNLVPCDVVVIGAGHFGGQDGIVNLLRFQGMNVRQLKATSKKNPLYTELPR